MNIKRIILASTLLGFSLPAIASISVIALSAKERGGSIISGAKDSPVHIAGCDCPFCQKSSQENQPS